jgi:outer membrane protein assembly factor BamB
VTEGSVVAIGPKCHVICCDPVTGELRWSLDLVRDFGSKTPPWYAGQCPLIDGDRVIIAPSGSSLVMAVSLASGEVLWESPNELEWAMTHVSILPMEFGGERFYVYCGSGGVAGVSVTDGRPLWLTEEWQVPMATVATPVDVGEGRIFLSGGYGAGSMMLQLKQEGDLIKPEVLFRLEDDTFGSAQQTPIFHQGRIFGVRPDQQLVCLDLEGNEIWTSTSSYKFGIGPYAVAGDLLYVMNDHGLLSRVEANPDAFRLVDQNQVLDGHDSWGPMAFANGRLILRDMTRMVCLDVSGR